jgi:hypothetical protein
MNDNLRTARRYHWLGEGLKDFVVEPHSAICCDKRNRTLNMVAAQSEEARLICTHLSGEKPEKVIKEVDMIRSLDLSRRHHIKISDIDPKKLYRILMKTYENQPKNFEKLLGISGIGPKAIRALSLLSELIYGKSPSYRDPARFSFAHGGKDGTPFPVDRETYDKTVEIMKKAINDSKLGNRDKLDAIRRLAKFFAI